LFICAGVGCLLMSGTARADTTYGFANLANSSFFPLSGSPDISASMNSTVFTVQNDNSGSLIVHGFPGGITTTGGHHDSVLNPTGGTRDYSLNLQFDTAFNPSSSLTITGKITGANTGITGDGTLLTGTVDKWLAINTTSSNTWEFRLLVNLTGGQIQSKFGQVLAVDITGTAPPANRPTLVNDTSSGNFAADNYAVGVPLPSTAVMGLAGMGALLVRRRMRDSRLTA
jgi:hypothetical protein